ncbi:adenosylcobinamide-GDP ribazoletransferase [Acetobacter malorum]|uniref:adenosylcobinamide-GDP ribazoletransferase n=1 Tax=Acetobacter malorum TaxID=178901 RepID=UPI0039ED2BCA
MSTPAPADSFGARLRLDLACGLSLLTRLPVGWLLSPAQRTSTAPWPMGRSIWCWPLMGAAIGAVVGAVFWLLWLGHVAALPAAGLALAFQCVLTGGLHEDGLADMADGCGGASRERRLEIMRDSRIGSYGVMALGLSLLVRASAVAALPAGVAVLALAVSACLARTVLLVLPACLPPARPDGLARSLNPLSRGSLWMGLTLAGVSVVALAGGMAKALASAGFEAAGMVWVRTGGAALSGNAVGQGMTPDAGRQLLLSGGGDWLYGDCALTALISLSAVAIALAACGLVGVAGRRLLGGYTGDVLGAAAVLSECLVLAGFTALL